MKALHSLKHLVAATLACVPLMAAAAAYPEQTVRLVVPFGPGGNIDATARVISQGVSEKLGATVIVENRAGAGGIVGSTFVARAAPDGYVALLGSTGALAALSALHTDLPFDPAKDFRAAGTIARVPLVLVVGADSPFNSVAELIAHARANPEALSMASTGTGTSNHLTGELFQTQSQTQFLHVPYKGSGQALTDLLGGQVDLMFDQLSSSLPMIQAGKLKALGVTTRERSAVAPELPTLHESGLPDFEASTTTGILFPAGVSDEVVEAFNAALQFALSRDNVVQAFQAQGAQVLPGPADAFDAIMTDEIAKWSAVVEGGNIQLEH